MKEIEIWEHVLKWRFEKNPTLLPDTTTWSNVDFIMMGNTLQYCLPLVCTNFMAKSPEKYLAPLIKKDDLQNENEETVQKIRLYNKILSSNFSRNC
ncbi:hypothetical protein RhiirA1_470656 [Rhizophagus irregularis]|uniref:Uncharacterized protein n=1 Tax=Rhizophagus irregularis TaxID=588596 RepID=A0A2N0R5Q7_9GLOM|nr:hypothetical protein RhiirA1_470656 [Rhizophagus irregularis]GET63090.1 BTB/POZ protein [Rhizophagus irregularis DAOM 181602=DAOM 197198]